MTSDCFTYPTFRLGGCLHDIEVLLELRIGILPRRGVSLAFLRGLGGSMRASLIISRCLDIMRSIIVSFSCFRNGEIVRLGSREQC